MSGKRKQSWLKSFKAKKEAQAKLEVLGEMAVSKAVMEGGRIVMSRLAKGLPARPGGQKGENIATVKCSQCRVRAFLNDGYGLLKVTYTPKDTSNYCVNGLKNKPKGTYCPNMKSVLDAAHFEFNEAVYHSSSKKE